jgi:hypothetical protein
VLHALEADINNCDNGGLATIAFAARRAHPECVRLCVQLGANVQPLLRATSLHPAANEIVQDIRNFLATTALNTSPHQYTL